MSRKRLKVIASNLAMSFITRYNDIDGYWALGLLYEVASKVPDKKITLDITSGESVPSYKHSDTLSQSYYEKFIRQAKNNGIDQKPISQIFIELTFNVKPTAKQIKYRNTWGEAFICKVIIIDDLNIKRSFAVRGWCGIHNSEKEHRSIRRFI